MAPQIGPKDAPTITKKPTRFSATWVTARIMPMVTPIKGETVLGILGSMVPKLFEAMKVQKHVGATDAAAKRKNMTRAAPLIAEKAAVKAEGSAGDPGLAPG